MQKLTKKKSNHSKNEDLPKGMDKQIITFGDYRCAGSITQTENHQTLDDAIKDAFNQCAEFAHYKRYYENPKQAQIILNFNPIINGEILSQVKPSTNLSELQKYYIDRSCDGRKYQCLDILIGMTHWD